MQVAGFEVRPLGPHASHRIYRCFDCGAISEYTHQAVGLMTHQPHCQKCGGCTEEADETFFARNKIHVEEVGRLANKLRKVVRQDGVRTVTGREEDVKKHGCRKCGKAFRTKVALKLHKEDFHAK